jgi:hypothetical protein
LAYATTRSWGILRPMVSPRLNRSGTHAGFVSRDPVWGEIGTFIFWLGWPSCIVLILSWCLKGIPMYTKIDEYSKKNTYTQSRPTYLPKFLPYIPTYLPTYIYLHTYIHIYAHT